MSSSIPSTLLIAAEPFSERLPARTVAGAIATGICDAGLPRPDVCELPATCDAGLPEPDACELPTATKDASGKQAGAGQPSADADGAVRESPAAFLSACDFDARMRAARAVVIAPRRLDESTLLGSLCFEIATRARQSGVPAYAITAEVEIDRFDARILDLQVVLEARGAITLQRAGRELAALV